MRVLDYSKPRNAVYEHVPLKVKNALRFLTAASSIGESPTLEHTPLKFKNPIKISDRSVLRPCFRDAGALAS